MKRYQSIIDLYQSWAGSKPERVEVLSADGSSRQYIRLVSCGRSVIGTLNGDRRENQAFLTLSRHFRAKGLPVPEIFADDLDQGIYLQQDLGDKTLYSSLTVSRSESGLADETVDLYGKVVQQLAAFQVKGAEGLDFSVCYPREAFDSQSIHWDLNYFKYHFLRFAGVSFDEQRLEDDFDRLTTYLLEAETGFFLYRDFQSRNIMVHDGQPWFIDYQGGRRGALQYDIASLLQDGKADIPWAQRETILCRYLENLQSLHSVDEVRFMQHYYGYGLIRLMQALGAYGFRGLHEGKSYFLKSIGYGIRNLDAILERAVLPVRLDELESVWAQIRESQWLREMGMPSGSALTVHIASFSYHKGLPQDVSGNGGGFVFDCRILPNPGRLPEYARLTGMDTEVVSYLEKSDTVTAFRGNVFNIVDRAVSHHLSRGFTDLTVNFGCTGGQHRSVYFAEETARRVRKQFGVNVSLDHREQEHLKR